MLDHILWKEIFTESIIPSKHFSVSFSNMGGKGSKISRHTASLIYSSLSKAFLHVKEEHHFPEQNQRCLFGGLIKAVAKNIQRR